MGKPREAGGGPSGPNRSEAEGPWWPPGYSGAMLSSASVVWARDLGLKAGRTHPAGGVGTRSWGG